MRLPHAAALLTAALLAAPALAGGTFKLDGTNTKVEFVGTKPEGKHEGGFKKVSGTASAAENDPTTLKVNVEIDTTSLYSDNPKLTQHLKSPDFFGVKAHPTAKFVSSKIARDGDKGYTVTGKLTLLDETKEITFPASIVLADGSLTLTSRFEIDRTEFGMTFGRGKVDDKVTLKVSVKAGK